jgi:hypothetical protein
MRDYLTRPGARQAIRPGDYRCAYELKHLGETHRCAVGCLLSPEAIDDLYAIGKIQGNLDDVLQLDLAKKDLEGISIAFLRGAQGLHDDARSWVRGKFKVRLLDDLAKSCNLTVVTDEPAKKEEAVGQPICV